MALPELISKNKATFLILTFLDVGDGDCVVVHFPSGRLMVVDINSPCWFQGRLQDTYSVIQQIHLNTPIWRYIQTHPDLDHMTGLCDLSNHVTIHNFWDVKNTKRLEKGDFSRTKYDASDWQRYRSFAEGGISGTKTLSPAYLEEGQYWKDDGIWIFGPTDEEIAETNANRETEYNSLSRILWVSYGSFRALLTGDADVANLQRLVDTQRLREFLPCHVFKAPHHGKESGYCIDAMRIIKPTLTVVSCAEPSATDATDSYRSHSKNVLRTHEHGTITVLASTNGSFWVYDENGNQVAI